MVINDVIKISILGHISVRGIEFSTETRIKPENPTITVFCPVCGTTMYTTKFNTTSMDDAKLMLKKHGMAVLEGVFTPAECEQMASDVWGQFEYLCQHMDPPLSRKDPKTWKPSLTGLFPLHSMLFQRYINHCQPLWNARQDPRMLRIFQSLYETDGPMLVSFDGMSFLPAPELGGYGFYNPTYHSKKPFHADQSLRTDKTPHFFSSAEEQQAYVRPTFRCVQGFLSVHAVAEGDATLAVLSDSHKVHGDFLNDVHPLKDPADESPWKPFSADWYQFTPDELQYFKDRGCQEHRLMFPAGSFVMWDSRVVHQLRAPERGRSHMVDRLVLYICMTPRSRCTEKILAKRKTAYSNLRGTSHWPEKCMLFDKAPRTRGRPMPRVEALPAPSLTAIGRQLVGLDDEEHVHASGKHASECLH